MVAKYQETQHRLSFWAGKKAQVAEAAKAVLEAQKAREAALALGVEDPDKEANLRQAAVALHQAKTQVAASEVEVAAADASRVEAEVEASKAELLSEKDAVAVMDDGEDKRAMQALGAES